jgi:hypothetical protein
MFQKKKKIPPVMAIWRLGHSAATVSGEIPAM